MDSQLPPRIASMPTYSSSVVLLRRWLRELRGSRVHHSRIREVKPSHNEIIMHPTTEKIPSANSTGAPYVVGNFAPLKSEVTAFDLEVIGHVPEELSGRFLRIGPNPIDEL